MNDSYASFFLFSSTATILGDKDVYIDVGSSLNLTCNVLQMDSFEVYPHDPHFIIWKKNNKVFKFTTDVDNNIENTLQNVT